MEQTTLQDGTQLDPKVLKVMRTIRTVETGEGGKYDDYSGDGGTSAGAFQWNNGKEKLTQGQLPKNYLGHAQEAGVQVSDFSKASQNKVAYSIMKKWKDEGLDPEEVAAKWNGAKKGQDGKLTYKAPEYGEKFRKILNSQESSTPNTSLSTEKKLTFADIQQKDAETTPVSDPNAPGNVISNLSEGNYGGALQSGIRGFANLVTLGGSEDLAQGISSPVAYGAEKIKGFFGGKDYSKYVTPQTEKEKDQAYSGGAKSAAVIGTLATLGAGSGMLAASRAKILTTPAVLDNIAVPAQTFLNASKITQLNYLKNALKTAQASRSGQTIGQIEEIAKAIKYLTPSSSWITKLLKSGFKEATRFALYNILGNKVGGIVSGVLQD